MDFLCWVWGLTILNSEEHPVLPIAGCIHSGVDECHTEIIIVRYSQAYALPIIGKRALVFQDVGTIRINGEGVDDGCVSSGKNWLPKREKAQGRQGSDRGR